LDNSISSKLVLLEISKEDKIGLLEKSADDRSLLEQFSTCKAVKPSIPVKSEIP
jgi:hypothetical protein